MTLSPRRVFCLTFVIPALAAAGCGSRGQVEIPSLSPAEAASAAMAQYDTNKDGKLDEKELGACPSLKSLLKGKDGITEADIAARLEVCRTVGAGVGIRAIPVKVLLNGAPLEGATVTFVPEGFMGSSFKSATGISDAKGNVLLRVEGESLTGCQWGFFKVQVSKKDGAGTETLSSRYNLNTVLGCDVPPDGNLNAAQYRFALNGK